MAKEEERKAAEEAADTGAEDASGEPSSIRKQLNFRMDCLSASVGFAKDIMGIAEKEAGRELPRTRALLTDLVTTNIQTEAFLRERVVPTLLRLGEGLPLPTPEVLCVSVDHESPAIYKGDPAEVVARRFRLTASCLDTDQWLFRHEWRFSFLDRETGERLVYAADDNLADIVVRKKGEVHIECRRVGENNGRHYVKDKERSEWSKALVFSEWDWLSWYISPGNKKKTYRVHNGGYTYDEPV